MSASDSATELLELNQRLLDAIADGDWETYAELCDAGITGFEPEAGGHLVEGLDFHKFYFDLGESAARTTPPWPRRTCGCWAPTRRWSAGCLGQSGHAAIGRNPRVDAPRRTLEARALSSLGSLNDLPARSGPMGGKPCDRSPS